MSVKLTIGGDFALFTRPEMKAERFSYDCLTPSAARGILEAIHWKPALKWIIEEIHVLKPIKFYTIRRNELGSKIPPTKIKSALRSGDLSALFTEIENDRQQRAATVLTNVKYVIKARFEFTDKKGPEDNEGKHLDIFNRRLREGKCFHQPCLGAREFPAYFRPYEEEEDQKSDLSASDLNKDLGFMLWDINFTDKNKAPMFFRARLKDGILKVPQPGSEEIRQ